MKNEIRLAQYRPLRDYAPSYGDYVVWSKWFSTWHGVVSNYDPNTGELYIIFGGMPFLLFTMAESEQQKQTKKIKIEKIKNAPQGNWAVQQHDHTRNATIWYI